MNRFLFFLIALVVFSGCRNNETMDGPDLNDLFGPFSILTPITPNTNAIDFATDGDIFFEGELSKNTNWEINLTGATSGAFRKIEGFQRIISIENALWNGGANTFPGFVT